MTLGDRDDVQNVPLTDDIPPTPNDTPITTAPPPVIETKSEPLFFPEWREVAFDFFRLEEPLRVKNPVLTAADVTDVPAKFVADPFLFVENGNYFLFLEVLTKTNNQGDIAVARSRDGFNWTYDRIVLDEAFHLSYPFVFKSQDKYYMIPETYQKNAIMLYETTKEDFPYGWNKKSPTVLISGKPYLDSSIFRYNDLWWIFTSDASNTYIYYSESLQNPQDWKAHLLNPVISNNKRIARHGGRSLVLNQNKLYRIAQKDDVTYGEKVLAFQVEELTTSTFREREISESPLLVQSQLGDWRSDGMHQLDCWWQSSYWLCATDGKSSGIFSIGIFVSNHPAAPRASIEAPSHDIEIVQGDSVHFSGTAASDDTALPLAFAWDFGVESRIDSRFEQNPGLIRFEVPGIFDVLLAASDSLGRIDGRMPTRRVTVKSGSPLLDRANWRIHSISSEETARAKNSGANFIDNDPTTIWHSEWSDSRRPMSHEVVVAIGGQDPGTEFLIDGFQYLPRQDLTQNGTFAENGRIKRYAFYLSMDGANWGTPVAVGKFENSPAQKSVYFAPQPARYFKLQALSEVNGATFASGAEIFLTGTENTTHQ